MKNIELKISLDNSKEILAALKRNGAKNNGILKQVDTYFNTKKGRLKTREIDGSKLELIYYQRPDTSVSKISNYDVVTLPILEGKKLLNALTNTSGIKVIVKKERNLWIHKNTRIHIDKVENLGNFLELETVINEANQKIAKQEHDELINLLNITNCKKYKESYSDLLKMV